MRFTHKPYTVQQNECWNNHVLIGVPDLAALKRVAGKLAVSQIQHYCWFEPDFPEAERFTAICTAPISGVARSVLSNYRVYKDTPVTQLRECSDLNREVVGENPTGRASLCARGPAAGQVNSKLIEVGSTPTAHTNAGGAEASAALS